MRCKKHYADLSSTVGVCASCLRERLFPILAAQEQTLTLEDNRRCSDASSAFPRSVSPYINCRKSVGSAAAARYGLPDRRFFSTPQVRPVSGGDSCDKKRGFARFFWFSRLFRSRNRNRAKLDSDSEPRVSASNFGESCGGGNATASPSWFSSIVSGGGRGKKEAFYVDDSSATTAVRKPRCRDRGMSPVRYNELYDGASGYESSESWKQTPRRTPAHLLNRGGGHGRNISGLAFCLSPLVRASPNRHWQKGMPAVEGGFSGEIRSPAKPHLAVAKSFSANRSRKLADFGRFNPNR